MALAAPQLVQIGSVGEHVTLAIGNWQRQLHYETALLLAYWMQRRAREAKRWANKDRAKLYATGTLHDALAGPNAGQPFTPNGVRIVRRDVLRLERIEVEQNFGDVRLRFEGAEMGLPWKAALQIAQWIRLRAKESKARAGDTGRHWGRIVAASDPSVTRG